MRRLTSAVTRSARKTLSVVPITPMSLLVSSPLTLPTVGVQMRFSSDSGELPTFPGSSPTAALNHQAFEAFRQGNYNEALEKWGDMLKFLEKNSPPNSVSVTGPLNNMACLYGQVGEYRLQLQLLTRVLNLMELNYGMDHAQRAICLYNLATACGGLGQFKKMREHCLEAIRINSASFGPNHAKTAKVVLILAEAEEGLGNYQAQLEAMQRALVVIRRHCGQRHVQVVNSLVELARAYSNLKDYDKEKQAMDEALQLDQALKDSGHPQSALTMRAHGVALMHQNLPIEAKEVLCNALELQKRSLGSTDKEQVQTLIEMGRAMTMCGELSEARACMDRALALAREFYRDDNAIVGKCALALAKSCEDMKDIRFWFKNAKLAKGILVPFYELADTEVLVVKEALDCFQRAEAAAVKARLVEEVLNEPPVAPVEEPSMPTSLFQK